MRVVVCAVVLAGLLFSTTGHSSESKALTRERFVSLVLSGPTGRAIDQEFEIERGRAAGAGLWPNPSVSWNREALPSSGVAQSTQDVVWLSVPLVLSGRTFAAARAARGRVEAADLIRVSRRADLRRRASVLFYEGLAAHRRRRLIQTALEHYEEVAAVLNKRTAAGETSGYDALRLEMERAAIEDRAAAAALETARLRAQMYELAGIEVEHLAGALEGIEADLDWTRTPLAARLRALELRVTAARTESSAASRRVVPDPIVGAGIQRQGGERGDDFLGYYVGIQVPLPFFQRGQGEAARADANARRLELEREQLLRAAAATLNFARRRLVSNRERLKKQLEVAAKGATLLEIAEKAYALGGAGLLTLLDAERSALDARVRATDRALDVRVAEADVAFVTGAYDEQGDVP